MRRGILIAGAIVLSVLAAWLGLTVRPAPERLPGTEAAKRRLVRIWLVSAPGGGESWLRSCLKSWERRNPGAMTFLRAVSADEALDARAVLPDLILYMPGDFARPEGLFAPVTGVNALREELARAGRWQGTQYGLPLCYAGYALAIDSALEPGPAQTPAPTALLGRSPAVPSPAAVPTPGLPEHADLICSDRAGLFALGNLLPHLPALADSPLAAAAVYRRFQSRQAGAALLTTGQIKALEGVFPFRVMVPQEIITDQLFMASVLPGADDAAADLLAHLLSCEAQRLLSAQGLHTVRDDLRLYLSGTEAAVESAAARSLTALNAYVPPEEVHASAWQFYQGSISADDALLPLL